MAKENRQNRTPKGHCCSEELTRGAAPRLIHWPLLTLVRFQASSPWSTPSTACRYVSGRFSSSSVLQKNFVFMAKMTQLEGWADIYKAEMITFSASKKQMMKGCRCFASKEVVYNKTKYHLAKKKKRSQSSRVQCSACFYPVRRQIWKLFKQLVSQLSFYLINIHNKTYFFYISK